MPALKQASRKELKAPMALNTAAKRKNSLRLKEGDFWGCDMVRIIMQKLRVLRFNLFCVDRYGRFFTQFLRLRLRTGRTSLPYNVTAFVAFLTDDRIPEKLGYPGN